MKDNSFPKRPTLIHKFIPAPLAMLKWTTALLICFYSFKLDEPFMHRCKTPMTLLVLTLSMLLLVVACREVRLSCGSLLTRCKQALFLLVLILATTMVSYDTFVFQYKKSAVLNAPQGLLVRLGRHFIVGYEAPEDILRLVQKRAIGGVYVTTRNIRNRSAEAVRQELMSFQSIALKKGSQPLFLAADQEGGKVSRLSPLLSPMPSLSGIVEATSINTRLNDGVRAYAVTQAKQLAELGINLNLSPVVDLKTDRLSHKLNLRSRIDQRAISANVDTVTEVAGIYCAASLNQGVRPTLKHFPGLGSVSEDTHFRSGNLSNSRYFLERNDWRPFKEIVARTDPFIMLGHVRVSSVDPIFPASLSPAIISGIIRNQWDFNGILITDDFNMGAIAGREEGIGKSAVRAINAGADLVLLSYDGSQYYIAMYEMIKAYQNGLLDRTALKKSGERLFAFKPPLPFMTFAPPQRHRTPVLFTLM